MCANHNTQLSGKGSNLYCQSQNLVSYLLDDPRKRVSERLLDPVLTSADNMIKELRRIFT